MQKKGVPKSLQIWFLIHFIVDFLIGIPLIIFPKFFLSLFGIISSEYLTARLVGAALLGIGGASLFNYNKKKESYEIMLTLKIIWSLMAILSIIISLIEGVPKQILLILLIFTIFSFVWIYYKIRIKKL